MTTLPTWSTAEWSTEVPEPFRSDGEFWSSLAASADALVSLAAAVAVAVILALTGQPMWAVVPFIVPAVLTVRAVLLSRASSRQSRNAFPDRRQWRDAERAAVASAFFGVVRHRRSAGL